MDQHREDTGKLPVILVVDDDQQNLELVQAYLEDIDCKTVAARDGIEALEIVAGEKPDLILLDVMMPYVDGFEVLRRLKEAPDLKHIPVIMLTARTSDADVSVGFDIGAADYVEKPFSIAKLLARVRRVLRETGAIKDPNALPAGEDEPPGS